MSRRPGRLILISLAAAVAALVTALPALSANPKTKLISQSSSGATTDAISFHPSVSGDGRLVAFASDATTLVAHDTNGQTDVFVRNTKSGNTKRVSITSNGGQATGGGSLSPAISGNGRYVVFSSAATNLPGAGQGVYSHDLKTGKTKLIAPGGNPLDPAISASGRYIAWDENSGEVFLFDRNSGKTKVVSKNNQGDQDDAVGDFPSISDDGRYVAWISDSGNLTPQSAGDHNEVYLHDLKTKKTRMLSKVGSGEGNGDAFWVAIAGNASRVVYASRASNLVGQDLMGHQSVFVFTRKGAKTSLASKSSAGAPGNNGSSLFSAPGISKNGRFVAFASRASNLVGNDLNGRQDVFVRNLKSGNTKRVSVASNGAEADDLSESAALSADARFIAFQSRATNLDGGGAFRDIFRRGPLR